ncbi:glycoside hydrolase family 38 C-terminal domain-containing protein [Luteipulveratus sp. YIM 133132]|uniref:alpha-mannosidase n=1 Tax=Luteipulveratus flavus TaxID=3031728 RepID=UPI0023B1FCA9|nr:glycoside hydrolase family 38 C-terminal domain-containing protein [Luteipulveratus sp. YIM 133132]MDE9365930.1 glycoside hydrolase family 38 C-terminal domain-containing protein [Luteipulveratus sp. YIM 133132]
MHDQSSFIRSRLHRFRQEYLPAALYRERTPLRLTRWDVPDEPVPFAEAVVAEFVPFVAGAGAESHWGSPWGTTWFHVTGTLPEGWSERADSRVEALVDLGFNAAGPGFQAEATAYDADGRIIKGIEPLNAWVPRHGITPDGRTVDFYVEAAANPYVPENGWFIPTPLGSKATAGRAPLYELRSLDLVLLDVPVWELTQDVQVLAGYLDELPADSPRVAGIEAALDRMLDAVDPRDLASTAPAGRKALEAALASPAVASAHQVVATGHAHIDSAWLWPTRETVRKCARTFSNVLDLMEEDADLVFACSSAQQLEWIRLTYPELFERIRTRAVEGRFVPVGGMWVESDTNLPGGEALARQLVEGKLFFLEHFGIDTSEVWLPDSFGYSAALPQLVRASGSTYFLTQKISWNDTNRMPHHTFHWEGIDGTRVFTHFPPVDTYTSDLSARDLRRAERQFREKGRTNISLVPFGWGDGGGGPTREMLAAAHRQADLEGAPRVTLGSPRQFFERAEADYPSPPVWSGELYLEYHRGTYTSQARTKRGNRRSEHLLREAELWATLAAVRAGRDYPYDELQRLWRVVLLNQFHDILPGSSISWVHEEAERDYAEVESAVETIIDESLKAVLEEGDSQIITNAGPYDIAGVPALGGTTGTSARSSATVTSDGRGAVLAGDALRVRVDARGELTSVLDLLADREVLPAGTTANRLQLFEDIPNQWDAWDVNDHYRRNEIELRSDATVTIEDDAVVVTRSISESTVRQRISLSPDGRAVEVDLTIDWHERQRLLKVAVPVDVLAERATSEIQFGHVHRPIHQNTSWDAARFETCAHRWVHVGETGYGVAVANDATYGHDIQRIVTADGVATQVRLSLLRAPQFPDPDADTGRHRMRYSIRPGSSVPDAVAEGYRMNLPLRRVTGARAPEPVLTVDEPAIVVEAVKLAADRSGDVVVRLYEAYGSRATGTLRAGFGLADAVETDLLEREVERRAVREVTGENVRLQLRPFELVTIRLRGC